MGRTMVNASSEWMTRRYVFLDIDGVINHQEWYGRIWKERAGSLQGIPMNEYHMDPLAVQRLNRLKGSSVIISSSWDYCQDTVEGLKKAGLELPIIGGIDHIEYVAHHLGRGNAIAKWFSDNFNTHIPWDYLFDAEGWYNTHVTYDSDLNGENLKKKVWPDNIKITYVILDDDSDMMLQQRDHFIEVDSAVGLTDADIEKAKKMLNI